MEIKIESEELQQYSLFNGLLTKQIDAIQSLMNFETFAAGDRIVNAGGPNDKLYFILEGRVSVIKSGITLTELKDGEIFGEIEILDMLPAEATIMANATTKVLTLSNASLKTVFSADEKAFAFLVLNMSLDLCSRLRRMNKKVSNVWEQWKLDVNG
jgi:signal-transduction protein with cAMP-binding, CBS, and nucleotidyltransferase domain